MKALSMFRAHLPILLIFLLFSGAGINAAIGAGIKVIYPAKETGTDPRFNDLIEILETALRKTVAEYGPFEIMPSPVVMAKARYLTELENGRAINITWSSTSREMEARFSPLRIPLRKGLLGYRIGLIAKDNQARIDQVRSVEDLKKLTVGQGVDWGDIKLYEAMGIEVTKTKYENLFKMVAAKRFDIFPRGIGEILPEFEVQSKSNPNLAIERNLLIYYPWPYYFFFNRNDAALQKRIEVGLRKMISDGSFEAIFRKYNGKAIELADFKHRRVIRIENPLLPKETPLDDPLLWFDPSKY